MSTDRNEKISNHEKGMFRDNLPSADRDQTNLVSEVEMISVIEMNMPGVEGCP